jgi:hypothetical protein
MVVALENVAIGACEFGAFIPAELIIMFFHNARAGRGYAFLVIIYRSASISYDNIDDETERRTRLPTVAVPATVADRTSAKAVATIENCKALSVSI